MGSGLCWPFYRCLAGNYVSKYINCNTIMKFAKLNQKSGAYCRECRKDPIKSELVKQHNNCKTAGRGKDKAVFISHIKFITTINSQMYLRGITSWINFVNGKSDAWNSCYLDKAYFGICESDEANILHADGCDICVKYHTYKTNICVVNTITSRCWISGRGVASQLRIPGSNPWHN